MPAFADFEGEWIQIRILRANREALFEEWFSKCCNTSTRNRRVVQLYTQKPVGCEMVIMVLRANNPFLFWLKYVYEFFLCIVKIESRYSAQIENYCYDRLRKVVDCECGCVISTMQGTGIKLFDLDGFL